jgi:hypothetical protein
MLSWLPIVNYQQQLIHRSVGFNQRLDKHVDFCLK